MSREFMEEDQSENIPAEHLETGSEFEPEILLRSLRSIGRYYSILPAVLDNLRQDEEMRRQESTNPEQFARIVEDLTKEQVAISPQLMQVPAETDTRRKLRAWEERVVISTVYGERSVIVPKSDEGKIDNMRRVLRAIEESADPDGGYTNKQALEEQALVISGLFKMGALDLENGRELLDNPERQDAGNQLRQIGERRTAIAEKMYKEFQARLALHGMYRNYEKSGSAQNFFEGVSGYRGDYLNTLFHEVEGVWEAFLDIDEHAEEFLTAPLEAGGSNQAVTLNQLRERIATPLAERYKFKVTREKDDGQPGEMEVVEFISDPFWAERTAERLWEVLCRRTVRDGLIARTELAVNDTEFEKERKAGKVRFLSSTQGGGAFSTRRAMRFKDYLDTNRGTFRAYHDELLKDVDLSARDFFSSLPGDLERYYRTQFENIFLRNNQRGKVIINRDGYQVEAGVSEAAQEQAMRKVESIFGIKKTIKKSVQEAINNGKKEPEEVTPGDREWPRLLDAPEEGKLGEGISTQQLRGIDIQAIDFSVLRATPLLDWALYNVLYPDGARDALMGKEQDGFLFKPTSENLYKLHNAFTYQADGQFSTKAKILENYAEFSWKDLAGAKIMKPDRAMTDTLIFASASKLGLQYNEAIDIAERVLGKGVFDQLAVIFSYYKADRFIASFLLELLKGVFQQSIRR